MTEIVSPTASTVRDLRALEARTRDILASDLVTAATRRALLTRLAAPRQEPRTFDGRQLRTLEALAGRLVPLSGLDLALRLDTELADGPGDGWRYADMPPDRDMHRLALDRLASAGFVDMPDEAQDAVLTSLQSGAAPGGDWPFRCDRWFEEVLSALVRLAYGHPLTQVAIGYDGFADAHGMAPSA